MATSLIPKAMEDVLLSYLKSNPRSDLLTTYLYFLSEKHSVSPILFPKEKKIFIGLDDLIAHLEKDHKLWRETEIKIKLGQQSVNSETKRIYICPFSGKVFGDNTHPNPLDAIYDWVSTCPENTEFSGGLKVKKFFVSEDPEVMKNYIQDQKGLLTKTVFSSVITGKLFNSKKAVIDDFKKHHIKAIPLVQVPNQNRFQIDDKLLAFIQENIEESKVSAFVEATSQIESLASFAKNWAE